MKKHIFNSTEELIDAFADYFIDQANAALQTKGRFNVALSGGNSPKEVYKRLSSDQYRDKTDWNSVFFFFGDERYVPSDNPQSNARMAQEILFDPLGIPADHIFKVDTSLPADEAADQYAKTIKNQLDSALTFDLVMLGLGDNVHTASLFPNTPVLDDDHPTVRSVFIPEQDTYRISFTAPLINRAHQIAFLVYGSGKAPAVSSVFDGYYDPHRYPAQLIKAHHWFLDKEAASLI